MAKYIQTSSSWCKRENKATFKKKSIFFNFFLTIIYSCRQTLIIVLACAEVVKLYDQIVLSAFGHSESIPYCDQHIVELLRTL